MPESFFRLLAYRSAQRNLRPRFPRLLSVCKGVTPCLKMYEKAKYAKTPYHHGTGSILKLVV